MRCRRSHSSLPASVGKRAAPGLNTCNAQRISQIPALRVAPRCKQVLRVDDNRIARAISFFKRVASNDFCGNILIHDLIDEGAIGPVLQQAPDQVGEQIMMCTHRRIDAATCTVLIHDHIVQRLTHAVQALKLKRLIVLTCHIQNGRYRVRIVGGKLRVDTIAQCQQPTSTRDVAHIRIGLARKHGKPV